MASSKSKKTPSPASRSSKKPWHVVQSSSIHSRGVFAARDIPKGTEFLEYYGEKISKEESLRRSNERLARSKKTGEAAVYIFDLNEDWDLDGSSIEPNDARFINHSCSPNCEAYQDEEDRIFITAERDIKKGEELTYNYGFDLEHWDEHPCLCGSENCVGFIVDRQYWPGLLKVIQRRANAIRLGKAGKNKKPKTESKKPLPEVAEATSASGRRAGRKRKSA